MQSTITRKRAIRGLLILSVCALYTCFLYPSPEYCIYNKDDAGSFMTMGLNLAQSGRYSVDTFPKADYGHHGTWPPVFPLILASTIRLFGLNWVALKFVIVLFGLGHLWLLWHVFRRISADRPESNVATWAVTLTALSPMYFLFSHMTMTEIPFMFISTAVLLLMLRSASWKGALLAGLVAVVAFYIRGYAIVFLPVGILSFLLKRDWSRRHQFAAAACFAIPLLVGIVLWSWYTRHIIATQTLDGITAHYGNVGVFASNIQRPWGVYARDIYWYHCRFVVHLLMPFLSQDTALKYDALAVVGGLLITAMLAGSVMVMRRGDRTMVPWLLASAILLLVGGINNSRYCLTYLPFMIYLLLTAFEQWSTDVKRIRWLYASIASLLLLGTVVGLSEHLRNPDTMRFISPYWKEFRDATLWARDTLPLDAVIVTHSPHNAYASSGLRAVGGPPADVNEWPPELLSREQHVYILGPKTRQGASAAAPRMKECEFAGTWIDHDPRFDVIYEGDHLRLWRFRQ